MEGSTFLFYVFSIAAVGSALRVVTHRNAIHAAVYLVLTFFNLAALFVLLEAHFLAAAQVLIYAGAITVLILFVIMLLDVETLRQKTSGQNPLVKVTGLILVLTVVTWFVRYFGASEARFPELHEAATYSAPAIGHAFFTKYLLAFELTGLLLLAAIIAAVAIAHKETSEI